MMGCWKSRWRRLDKHHNTQRPCHETLRDKAMTTSLSASASTNDKRGVTTVVFPWPQKLRSSLILKVHWSLMLNMLFVALACMSMHSIAKYSSEEHYKKHALPSELGTCSNPWFFLSYFVVRQHDCQNKSVLSSIPTSCCIVPRYVRSILALSITSQISREPMIICFTSAALERLHFGSVHMLEMLEHAAAACGCLKSLKMSLLAFSGTV